MNIYRIVLFNFLIPTTFVTTHNASIGLRVRQNLENHSAWSQIPTKSCGVARSPNRIVGGDEAYLGQFPWMVQLGFKTGRYGIRVICGGVLITKKFVVTAAHCFENPQLRYVIRLGENDASSNVDCDGKICAPEPQDFYLDTIFIHRQYNERTHINDIALLKLTHDADLNDFVQPICLPQEQLQDINFKHSGNGIVAGWGLTSSFSKVSSEKLLYVSLPFVRIDDCPKFHYGEKHNDSQLCVGKGNGKDSCGGDSGGPLMKSYRLSSDRTRRFYLLGIVSYGPELCGSGPAIYSKVAYFLDWILDIIEEE